MEEGSTPRPASKASDAGRAEEHKVWSKMVYIAHMGHVPAKRVLFSPKTRDKETHQSFSQFLTWFATRRGSQRLVT